MHTLFRKIEKIGTVVALALGIGQNGMGTAAGFNCETQRNASKRSAGAPALFGSAVAYTQHSGLQDFSATLNMSLMCLHWDQN